MKLSSRRPAAVDVDVVVDKSLWLVENSFRVVDQLLAGESVEMKVEASFQEFSGDQARIQMEFKVFSAIAVSDAS